MNCLETASQETPPSLSPPGHFSSDRSEWTLMLGNRSSHVNIQRNHLMASLLTVTYKGVHRLCKQLTLPGRFLATLADYAFHWWFVHRHAKHKTKTTSIVSVLSKVCFLVVITITWASYLFCLYLCSKDTILAK